MAGSQSKLNSTQARDRCGERGLRNGKRGNAVQAGGREAVGLQAGTPLQPTQVPDTDMKKQRAPGEAFLRRPNTRPRLIPDLGIYRQIPATAQSRGAAAARARNTTVWNTPDARKHPSAAGTALYPRSAPAASPSQHLFSVSRSPAPEVPGRHRSAFEAPARPLRAFLFLPFGDAEARAALADTLTRSLRPGLRLPPSPTMAALTRLSSSLRFCPSARRPGGAWSKVKVRVKSKAACRTSADELPSGASVFSSARTHPLQSGSRHPGPRDATTPSLPGRSAAWPPWLGSAPAFPMGRNEAKKRAERLRGRRTPGSAAAPFGARSRPSRHASPLPWQPSGRGLWRPKRDEEGSLV